MKNGDNRREFLQKLGAASFFAGTASLLPRTPLNAKDIKNIKDTHAIREPFDLPNLRSLKPEEIFNVLDLDYGDVTGIRQVLQQQGHDAALAALLEYYRNRFPAPDIPSSSGSSSERQMIERADNLGKNIFQRGNYPPADYGEDIDWAADPAGDIEWVAQINRFYWMRDLTGAYRATGDEKYIQTLVRLAEDWIRKHPLEETLEKVHPVYDYWKGYAWLDIETGRRAHSISTAFRQIVHADAFTPRFLGVLLASLYDHQKKVEKIPMGQVHNKSIFEQRGFVEIIHTFPEFSEREFWLDLAVDRTSRMLIAQTTVDGVQREYTGGYHGGVYADGLAIERQCKSLGRTFPSWYRERLREMVEYTFGISTPDLAYPMFGDTARSKRDPHDRSSLSLYRTLKNASREWGDPKFGALADLELRHLSENGSSAFPHAGLYALRNSYQPDQVYMALHCSPPAISSHDQPDNGTFELYAYGDWLMPDSGYFTYGLDPAARAWHRQSAVHATLTADGRDTAVSGRHLLWQSDKDQDLVCVENQSYQYLSHRRTVWFRDKGGDLPFFVILDEAIGTPPDPFAEDPYIEGPGGFDPVYRRDEEATLELHYPLAAGPVEIDSERQRIFTKYPNVNLVIGVAGRYPLQLKKESGWHAWGYQEREERSSVTASFQPNGPQQRGPASFVSVLIPWRGRSAPDFELLTDPASVIPGSRQVELSVRVAGKDHQLVRQLV